MEPRSSLFRNASIVPTAQNIFQVSTSYVISYYEQNSISKTMYQVVRSNKERKHYLSMSLSLTFLFRDLKPTELKGGTL